MATVLRRSSGVSRRSAILLAQVATVVVLIGGWEWLARERVINSFVVGTPTRILDAFAGWIADGQLWSNLATTLAAVGGGYLVALVVGIGAGVVLGLAPRLDAILGPFLGFWQGFPRLIFYPFFAVLLGYSIASRMLHIAFVIVFLIAVSTAAGVREVDKDMQHHVQLLGAGRWELVRDVHLPAAVSWVVTSARITIGFALQAAIVAEFTGASSGMGFLMVTGQNSYDVNTVWAAVGGVVVLAIVIDLGLQQLQRRLSRWAGA